MTRTARAAFPRAIIKDRSESKTGHNKSMPKNGAGHHNWGNIAHEDVLEYGAMDDGEYEEEETTSDTVSFRSENSLDEKKPDMPRSISAVTEEERQTAKEFRKGALKAEGLDLSAIARTSTGRSS